MYEFTARDKRAMQLWNKFTDESKDTRLKDYHHYLDTLIYLNQAMVDENVEIREWEKFSETLLMKFFFHGLTLHQIGAGLTLSSTYFDGEIKGASYIDVASARAVLRSKLETFLMFHYIYINPADEEVKQLRYYSWIYTGLLHRQDFPSKTEFAQQQKQKDIQEMKKLKEIIRGLVAFKQLTSKQQESLIREGSAKTFSHWKTIMEETGFTNQSPFLSIYTILSVYAHSEGLSAIQLNSAISDKSFQEVQLRIDIHHAQLLTCMMIVSLTNLFPVVMRRFETLPEELQIDIELLASMGKATGKEINQ